MFKVNNYRVQFHPEHAAGPTDMECLFDVFARVIDAARTNQNVK